MTELDRQVTDYKRRADASEEVSRADAIWLLNELIYERDQQALRATPASSGRATPDDLIELSGVCVDRRDALQRIVYEVEPASQTQEHPPLYHDEEGDWAAATNGIGAELQKTQRALGNCYMMAKREIARILNGKAQTDATSLERWQHVQRFCEETGLKSSILRAALPTEITDGETPHAPPGAARDPQGVVQVDTNWRDKASGEPGRIVRVVHVNDEKVSYRNVSSGRLTVTRRPTFERMFEPLASLRAAGAGQGWQSIETYSDDGEVVVVWNGQPYLGYYQDPDGWFADVDGELLRIDPPPTFWIPSPAAPPGGGAVWTEAELATIKARARERAKRLGIPPGGGEGPP